MAPSLPSLDIRVVDSLAGVSPAQWDALVGDHPMLSHTFLHTLHETGCASTTSGWTPRYLVASRAGALAGAMPLYLKMHSYGEYVFDWSWADAYRRHGMRYYPKLVSAVPFTPVTGPRLIAADASVRRALLDRALELMQESSCSSLHILFPEACEAAECEAAGCMLRNSVQFHWSNAGYADFAAFLSTFNHGKRANIRQERRKLAERGIAFERLTDKAIGDAQWRFFYRCYRNTYREHHSTPYLSLEFFQRIGHDMGERIMMAIGSRQGTPICAALDVFGNEVLWGRYWGATEYVPGLHFEACYYQAIEFCIERGIARFEGGAQGMHKLARGLMPVATQSAHRIADPDFADAIARYVARERDEVAMTVDELEQSSPFRRDDASGAAQPAGGALP
jgi:predicted N-acyltransferase